jgi:hypothetical protein
MPQSDNSTLSNVTAIGMACGVKPFGKSTWISDVTALNSLNTGIAHGADRGEDNAFFRSAVANQNLSGFGLDGMVYRVARTSVRDLAVAHSGGFGIIEIASQVSWAGFHGLVMVGNSNVPGTGIQDCGVGGNLRDGGIATDGAAVTNCRLIAPSTGMIVAPISLATSFAGKVSADDPANASDVAGAAAFTSITDWTGFSNAYRAWGRDSAQAFPHPSQQGSCTAGTCRIWDASLSASDTVLRDRLPVPTGNDVFTHVWSADGGTACAELPGAVWSGSTCTSTALHNARELIDDGIGNDNNLCESNEACLYTPNLGSYQGHGALVSAGAFANGAVTDVTLYRHSVNGR